MIRKSGAFSETKSLHHRHIFFQNYYVTSFQNGFRNSTLKKSVIRSFYVALCNFLRQHYTKSLDSYLKLPTDILKEMHF